MESNSRDKGIYEKIDQYVKGNLDEKEIQALWEEFAKNPELIEDLELEVGVREILREKAHGASKSKIHNLSNWKWHASAAAAVLVVIFIQLFRVDTPTELGDFLVRNIPNDQIETANGIRSKEMVISKADSLLNLGFAALSSGNEEKAMEIFSEVISNYNQEPYASKAYLNRGIIQYNDGKYTEAAENFEEAAQRASENRMISEKAYWYLGNAYINIDENEKALEAIGEAYNRDGVFRKAAFVLYRKLSHDLGLIDIEEENPAAGIDN